MRVLIIIKLKLNILCHRWLSIYPSMKVRSSRNRSWRKRKEENGQEEGQDNEKILNKKGKAKRRMANQRMVLSGYNIECKFLPCNPWFILIIHNLKFYELFFLNDSMSQWLIKQIVMVNECKGSLQKKKYGNFHRGEGVNSILFFYFCIYSESSCNAKKSWTSTEVHECCESLKL